MKTSEKIEAISKALVLFSTAAPRVAKAAENPFFKSKYADLATILEAVRTPLAGAGLAVLQSVSVEDSCLICTTRLIHTSGEWIEGTAAVTPVKHDPQAYGSAMTYARRYGLQALLSLAAEDDDATSAQPTQERQSAPAPPCTAKQRGMIFKLAGEVHGTDNTHIADTLDRKSIDVFEAVTMSQASAWISSLIEEKKALPPTQTFDFEEVPSE